MRECSYRRAARRTRWSWRISFRSTEILKPDEETARIYGRLRARLQSIGHSKMNDVWIAALCIQHDLPLLTNDRGFDTFTGLRVIHW